MALGLLGFVAGALSAQPAGGPPRSARAQDVLEALRHRLPEIAAQHGLEPRALEAMIRHDRDLWIDPEARLFYVCEGLDLPEESTTADGTVVSGTAVPNSSDVFKLHSLPGVSRVIYLDFNGHVTSGTSWNSSFTGGANIVSAPFDMDGSPSNWSITEKDRIQKIWQRVAEDFAAFGVDVTTEDPGLEALRRTSTTDQAYGIRVVISPSSAWYGNAGGVAYLNSFQWNSDTPCFVFSDRLGPNNEKYVAEAVSHEIGHTLGLAHDGQTNVTAYYAGHGDWAPIMGVGYYKPITQWSRGEYSLANNLEDDLARMPVYGAPVAVDDHGNTLATATRLSGTSVLTYGVIETRNDVDVFTFSTGAGTITFSVVGPSPAANLDAKIELLTSGGSLVTSSDPVGLSASLSATVAAGTYYLRVSGVGVGDPLSTGYSTYASIGEYRLTGSIVTTAPQPPIARASATPTSGTAPVTVAFSSAGSSDPDGTIVGTSWSFGDGTTSTAPNPSRTYSTAGSYTAVLTVTDNSGLTATASVVITVTAPVTLVDADVQQYTLAVDRNSTGSRAVATVKVLDRLGRVVPGVTVTMQWSGVVTGSSSATTNSSGVATLASLRVKKTGTITGTVTGVVAPAGFRYEPTLYAEPLSRSVSVTR
jgi:PKD repeat protein